MMFDASVRAASRSSASPTEKRDCDGADRQEIQGRRIPSIACFVVIIRCSWRFVSESLHDQMCNDPLN